MGRARVPASPEMIASYLAASNKLAAATLRRRLAAVADAHQVMGCPDPTKHAFVRKVFRGICRVHGARSHASTPLDIDMWARIIDALSDDLVSTRDRALLLVGFFCALRRSELVALQVEDRERHPEGWVLKVRRSKTNPFGFRQEVLLRKLAGSLCPSSALGAWLDCASIAKGPIFRSIRPNNATISLSLLAPQVGLILRQRGAEANLDVQHLSAHSLRSDFAVSPARAQINIAQIQTVTRNRTLSGLQPYIRDVGPPRRDQLVRLASTTD